MGEQLTIKNIRECQLEMMDYIDQICRSNNIEYSLAYGTLIGAVRHKGFIPWDDDVDILMLRKDYEKFLSLIKNDITFPYRIIDVENAYFVWSKICDRNTYVKELIDYQIPNYGVWIDVFPYDVLPSIYSRSGIRFRKKLTLIWKAAKWRAQTFSSLKQKKFKTAVKIAAFKFVFQPFPLNYFGKKWCALVQKYRDVDTGYVGFPCIYSDVHHTISKKVFDEYSDIIFEGHKYRTIKDYDTYLHTVYGDYMKLPPKDEQVPKHSYDAFWKKN